MSEEPRIPPRPDRVGLNDWLRLARAVPSACDLRKLIVAAVAIVIVQLGWSAIDWLAPRPPSVTPARILEFHSLYGSPFKSPSAFAESIRRPAWNLTAPVRVLVGPLTDIFAIDGRRDLAATALLRLLWVIAVLGAAGATIARIAVVEAATGGMPTLIEALRIGIGRAASVIAAPLYFLVIAVGLGLVSAAFGLVARLVPSLTAVVFVGPLVLGVATAVLLALIVATWPLIPVAVAAESDEAMEAVGRCCGYVRRRPLGFAAGVLFLWIIGTLGLAAFEVFLSASMHLAVWGMGLAAWPAPSGSMGGMIEAPAVMFVVIGCLAWVYAFFWSAAARVYLLMRQDADDVPSRGSAALR